MKKYSRKHIGFKTITKEGYELTIIDGSERVDYCTISLDGNVFEVKCYHAIRGSVKNRMNPSVCDVGYLGYGEHKTRIGKKHSSAYSVWHDMLHRCYDEKRQEIQPTYVGCLVHPDWHNFQVFAKWFYENYIDGYHLDKDIKFKGNKIYSAENCVFVSPAENTVEASAKHYRFLNPAGELVEIYNLAEFCRENGLNPAHMGAVHSYQLPHHKQWTKAL